GRQVALDLELEDVVPLREMDAVPGIEVAAQRANLLADRAVDLEAAVEELESRGRASGGKQPQRQQPRDPSRARRPRRPRMQITPRRVHQSFPPAAFRSPGA